MDSTGGDLNHAAKEIEVNEEKQNTYTLEHTESEKNVVGEKQEQGPSSSGSSSHDDPALAKLDSKVIKVADNVKEGEEAYAHLPEHEKEVVKRQLDIRPVKVTYWTLYRYATRNDIIILVVSAICAIAGGAVMPLMTVSRLLRISQVCLSED